MPGFQGDNSQVKNCDCKCHDKDIDILSEINIVENEETIRRKMLVAVVNAILIAKL